MAKFIKTTLKMRQALMKQFGLSITGIKNALAYKSSSERADRIREAALAAGGEIVESAFCPECSTRHTESEIIQTFANGVVLKINKRDNTAMLKRDNIVIGTYANVTMSVWDDLVVMASNIAFSKEA